MIPEGEEGEGNGREGMGGREKEGRKEARETERQLFHHHWDAGPRLGSRRTAKTRKHTLTLAQKPEVTLFKQILIEHLLDARLWANRWRHMYEKKAASTSCRDHQVNQ